MLRIVEWFTECKNYTGIFKQIQNCHTGIFIRFAKIKCFTVLTVTAKEESCWQSEKMVRQTDGGEFTSRGEGQKKALYQSDGFLSEYILLTPELPFTSRPGACFCMNPVSSYLKFNFQSNPISCLKFLHSAGNFGNLFAILSLLLPAGSNIFAKTYLQLALSHHAFELDITHDFSIFFSLPILKNVCHF